MKYTTWSLRLAAVCAAALLFAETTRAAERYRFVKEIPVGGDGGWDYLSVDATAHRLYVAHATKVVVIDTTKDEVAGEIADTPGVHGFAVAPELGRGFSSNGRENKIGVVDLSPLKVLTKVETGTGPDAVLFEPKHGEVWAFNHRAGSVTVINAASAKVVATIEVGGTLEFAQFDPATDRVFCNVEDKSEVVAFDAATHAVRARWPLAPGGEPTGLAIDVAHHRLFVGCGNAKLVVLDSDDGRVVASIDAGAGIDAAAFDPETQLAFTSNGGDGTVTIVHEDTPDKFSVVQTLTTARGSRTMTIDPASHKIYLASAKFEAAPATASEGNRARPRMTPGSFSVLEYELVR